MPTATLEKTALVKFAIDRGSLLEGLEAVSKFVPPKPSHPVLANVVFSIKQQMLTLKAFDLSNSLEMRYMVDADPSLEIEFCVSAKVTDLIGKFSPGEIKIEYDPETHQITFKQGKSKHRFNGMGAEEFPSLPTVQGTKLALIGDNLARSFGRVLYAVSNDASKQVLTAINIQAKDNQLKFASTDGHRLATFSITEPIENDLEINIPGESIQGIIKLISKASSLNFEADNSLVKLETDQWVFTSRLIEGQYPNYEQLIPKQFERETRINKSEFVSALERVMIISEQRNGIVCLDILDEQVKLYADVPDYGDSEEFIECQNKGSTLEKLAFNGKYLIDAVKNTTGEAFKVETNSTTSSAVFTGDDAGIALVMPIQIRQ